MIVDSVEERQLQCEHCPVERTENGRLHGVGWWKSTREREKKHRDTDACRLQRL